MPTTRLGEKDKGFAIIGAIPVEAEGLTYIYGRQSCDTRSMEGGDIDQGNSQFSGQEAMIILEDVFIPWEYVFMNGEYEFASMLVERFTTYHRRSYVCKSGAFICDDMLSNVCKHHVTKMPYEISRLAQDLAGGLMATMPSEKELSNEKIGKLLKKYLKGRADVKTEDRMRILRLIENMTLGRNAVGYLTESMHGAGSPQAQRVVIYRKMQIEYKKCLAKVIAGIEIEENGEHVMNELSDYFERVFKI